MSSRGRELVVTARLGWDIGGGSGSFLHFFLKLCWFLDAVEVVLHGSQPSKHAVKPTGWEYEKRLHRKIMQQDSYRLPRSFRACLWTQGTTLHFTLTDFISTSVFWGDHIDKKYESVSQVKPTVRKVTKNVKDSEILVFHGLVSLLQNGGRYVFLLSIRINMGHYGVISSQHDRIC